MIPGACRPSDSASSESISLTVTSIGPSATPPTRSDTSCARPIRSEFVPAPVVLPDGATRSRSASARLASRIVGLAPVSRISQCVARSASVTGTKSRASSNSKGKVFSASFWLETQAGIASIATSDAVRTLVNTAMER